jgi:hypothetical protein
VLDRSPLSPAVTTSNRTYIYIDVDVYGDRCTVAVTFFSLDRSSLWTTDRVVEMPASFPAVTAERTSSGLVVRRTCGRGGARVHAYVHVQQHPAGRELDARAIFMHSAINARGADAAKGMASPPFSCIPLASSGPAVILLRAPASPPCIYPNARAARPAYALASLRYHRSPIYGVLLSIVPLLPGTREKNCPHGHTYIRTTIIGSDAAHVF